MIIEYRASIILFNVLSSLKDKHKIFLLPANICPIVVLTYLKAGVAYEFVDISFDSLCINQEIVLDKMSKNVNAYAGVHFVHTFGVESNQNDFFSRVKYINPDFFVIDDRCLNIPEFRVNNLPSDVDLELFSTGYSKFVDIGWGGFGYLQSHHVYKQEKLLYQVKDLEKLTGYINKSLKENTVIQYVDSDWLGDTLIPIQPENYQFQVEYQISIVKEHKATLNKLYFDELPSEIILPAEFHNWRFNIRVPSKDELLKIFFEAGLFASSHYASISHLFGQLPARYAEKSHANIVNLFNDLRFDTYKAEKTINIIKKHLVY